MGNDQSKKNADVQIQLNHSKINTIRYVIQSKKRFMQATFGIQQKDYQSWKQNVKNFKGSNDYLLMPVHSQFSSKALCGTTGTVKVNYQNYPYLLIEQIQNRRAKKKRFDQTELWLLLYCLIEGQKQMRTFNNSKIGDVRPHNVFLNEQGNIKVSNLLSWPKQSTNYQKFLQNQITYLAPQDLKFIQTSSLDNQANKLSQIFSIGLTVLSASNLTDYTKVYNTKTNQFNYEQFQRVRHQWVLNNVYSDIFKATVFSLIQVNYSNRINQSQLQPWIQKYRSQILSRQDFIINDPPQKIINQVALIRKSYQAVNQVTNNQFLPTIQTSAQKRISNLNNFNLPLQGQRRLVDQKRLPPITVLPGTTAVQSMYTPNERISSNFVVPPTNAQHLNYESTSTTWQGSNLPFHFQGATIGNSTYVPRTNFEYKSSPVTKQLKHYDQQQDVSPDNYGEGNQPEITQQTRKNE